MYDTVIEMSYHIKSQLNIIGRSRNFSFAQQL